MHKIGIANKPLNFFCHSSPPLLSPPTVPPVLAPCRLLPLIIFPLILLPKTEKHQTDPGLPLKIPPDPPLEMGGLFLPAPKTVH